MRASTGSISKALAAAATLVASIAVPALAVEVGALDALGFGVAAQAPQTPAGEVVVATEPAPHRAAVVVRPAVSLKTHRPTAAVVVARVAATQPAARKKATGSGRTFTPKTVDRPSQPTSPQAPSTPATPATPTTPSTPTTPTAPSTPSTPSTPTTPTTPTAPATPPVTIPPAAVPPIIVTPVVPPVIEPPLSPPLQWIPRSTQTNLPDVVVEPLVPSPPDTPAAENSWGGPPSSWAGPARGTNP